jgi:hypothetical protein
VNAQPAVTLPPADPAPKSDARERWRQMVLDKELEERLAVHREYAFGPAR